MFVILGRLRELPCCAIPMRDGALSITSVSPAARHSCRKQAQVISRHGDGARYAYRAATIAPHRFKATRPAPACDAPCASRRQFGRAAMCAGASALDKRLSAQHASFRVACGPGQSPDYSPKRSGPHRDNVRLSPMSRGRALNQRSQCLHA